MSYHYQNCPRCLAALAKTSEGARICRRCQEKAWEERHLKPVLRYVAHVMNMGNKDLEK